MEFYFNIFYTRSFKVPVVDPLVGGPQQPLSSGHLTTQPSQKGHDLNHLVTGDFWEYPLYKVYMGVIMKGTSIFPMIL